MFVRIIDWCIYSIWLSPDYVSFSCVFPTFPTLFMTESIETGLLLLIVGMSTVFVVLTIVVYTGKGLIVFVNMLPQPQVNEIKPPDAHIHDLSGAKVAAISGAVHSATGGKGRITHIERIE